MSSRMDPKHTPYILAGIGLFSLVYYVTEILRLREKYAGMMEVLVTREIEFLMAGVLCLLASGILFLGRRWGKGAWAKLEKWVLLLLLAGALAAMLLVGG